MSLSTMFVINAVMLEETEIVIQFGRAGKEAEIAAQSIKEQRGVAPQITIVTPMGMMRQPSLKEQDRVRWQFQLRVTEQEYEDLGCPGVGAVFNLGFVAMPRSEP